MLDRDRILLCLAICVDRNKSLIGSRRQGIGCVVGGLGCAVLCCAVVCCAGLGWAGLGWAGMVTGQLVSTAEQCRLGLFQDSDFADDLEDSRWTSGCIFVHFWESNVRSNQLDVQEGNCSLAQRHGVRGNTLGRWFTDGWYPCFRPERLGHRSVAFFTER